MGDLSKHEVHELPLINRLIEDEVRTWLTTHLDLAAASFAGATARHTDVGRLAIDQVRHLHLAGAHYQLVPRIIDALRRAQLLADGGP